MIGKAKGGENICSNKGQVPSTINDDIQLQIQEAQKTSSRINAKKLHVGISYSNCKNTKTKRKS